MGIVKVMDENLSNKISAGEVVERVSSVVKELVENSIDAKSTIIKVELINAGIKEIRVTDNGIGMDESDALLCFTPHATSKIKNENDLYFISTLGFRGEALPSVASVSEVELKTSDGKTSTKVEIKGGTLIDKSPCVFSKGTQITVRNLFYNTPARLKFLKSFYTELNNVIALMNRLCLSHPNISFTLISDGKEILKTSGSNDLLKAIHEIYGFNVSKNMIKINGENLDYEVSGYISNINLSKSTKTNMIVLVNNRSIQNTYINKIIKDAYHTYLAETKYPIVVININVDPTLIDVNIHPTKQDIKFSKIESLEELLFGLIRDALRKKDNTYKGVSVNTNYVPYKNEYEETETTSYKPIVEEENISFNLESESLEYNAVIDDTLESDIINPIGLAMGTYLFASDTENVYIIDIHAANERINYERFMNALKNEKVSTINLLIPITLEFTKDEYMSIIQNKSIFESLGITYEPFGGNTIRVLSHPTWFIEGEENESINKIFDLVISLKEKFDRVKFNEQLAINLACKKSVKANTNIGEMERSILIKRLFKCEYPYTCPHGRPTIIKYTKHDLEKMFKRVD